MAADQRITERALQEAVVEMATVLGWHHFHAYDMRRSDPGWPDLTLVHPWQRRILFAELKGERGKVTPEQAGWLEVLGLCAGVECFVWRPAQWRDGTIEAVLRGAGEGQGR